mmetsp:Transcript_26590/g.39511  ORF Transcript_26590/g.39511 Transcript_26590/m.39511 type:complete len:83 (-) Transcript_26590:2371-2619(-)
MNPRAEDPVVVPTQCPFEGEIVSFVIPPTNQMEDILPSSSYAVIRYASHAVTVWLSLAAPLCLPLGNMCDVRLASLILPLLL